MLDFLINAYSHSTEWYMRLLGWMGVFCAPFLFLQISPQTLLLSSLVGAPFILYGFLAVIIITVLEPIIAQLVWGRFYSWVLQKEMKGLVDFVCEQYGFHKLNADQAIRNNEYLDYIFPKIDAEINFAEYAGKPERLKKVIGKVILENIWLVDDELIFNERLNNTKEPLKRFFYPTTNALSLSSCLFLGAVTFSLLLGTIWTVAGIHLLNLGSFLLEGCLLGTMVGSLIGLCTYFFNMRNVLRLAGVQSLKALTIGGKFPVTYAIPNGNRPATHALLPSLLDLPFLLRAFFFVPGGILFSAFILGATLQGMLIAGSLGMFTAIFYPLFSAYIRKFVLYAGSFIKFISIPRGENQQGVHAVQCEPIPSRQWWRLSRFDIPLLIHLVVIVGISVTQIPAGLSEQGIPLFKSFAQIIGEFILGLARQQGSTWLGLSTPALGFISIGIGILATRYLWATITSSWKKEGWPADYFDEVYSWSVRAFIAYLIVLPAKWMIEAYHLPLSPHFILTMTIALPVAAVVWPHIKDFLSFIRYQIQHWWFVRGKMNLNNHGNQYEYEGGDEEDYGEEDEEEHQENYALNLGPQPPHYEIMQPSDDYPGFYYAGFGFFAGSQIVMTLLMYDPSLISPLMGLVIILATGFIAQITPTVMLAVFHKVEKVDEDDHEEVDEAEPEESEGQAQFFPEEEVPEEVPQAPALLQVAPEPRRGIDIRSALLNMAPSSQ